MRTLKNFIADEKGMETVEWAVLAAIIVAGLITTIGLVGSNVKSAFNKLNTATTPQ